MNPLLNEFNTPFEVPPFDKIDTIHYIPAFEEAMKLKDRDINTIVSNREEPSFENTITAFDRSGKLLTTVSKIFFNLHSANTNEQMQAIARKIQPLITKQQDDIYLNEQLFKKIKTIYDKRYDLGLDPQQIRVTEKYYSDFQRRGAGLSYEAKQQLREINEELTNLSLKFVENLLAETNKNFYLTINESSDLEGLPQNIIDIAAEEAEARNIKGWVFTLDKSSMIPFLQYAKNRDLREKIYKGYFMRGNNGNANDNNETAEKMINLRVKKAALLGFKTYAHYIIEDNMAKDPANVYSFLNELWNAALPVAKKERAEIQKMIDSEGGNFTLQPWDWWYYAEIIRKERYDFNESDLMPYLSLKGVRDGMFGIANRLYGITLTQRTDLPVYAEHVETFEVKEADGSLTGILYFDYYPRSGKNAGAWCTDFRKAIREDGKRTIPVSSIVCNFTRPTGKTPALLNWDETETLFHEFGHALHGLFIEGNFYRTAGKTPRDYVELPSQIMENWADEPDVLRMYARHYQTGEVIPDELIERLKKSRQFNQGFAAVEYLAASLLDLDYHTLADHLQVSISDFEENSMDKIGLIKEILPRYRTTYFMHIFSHDYAAGYYAYEWAGKLDADAYNAFKESGDIFNQELAARFRKYCLAESGDDEGMVQYINFRGKEPEIGPLLRRRGLTHP